MTATVTHLWRMLVWGRALARHGALRPFESPKVPLGIRAVARIARVGTRAPVTPDFAAGLAAVGPAAVKLGQALATRPDLIGPEAALDLVRLQDSLPPLPFSTMEAVLNAAYDGDWRTRFQAIEPVPVGAASMAQVHRGVTTEGRRVAIKMLRPGIDADLARAIDTYEWAAGHIELLGGEFERLRPRAVIATFKGWTEAELDLRREAASASELAEAVQAEPDFVVPGIDWSRSSRRILVIDWIDGIKMNDSAALAALDFDRRRLAMVLVNGFLAQAIAQGFFHADMHQGNLFVIPPADGSDHAKLAVIDFGIMGRINRRARMYLAEILHGLVTGNYARVAEIHFEAGYVPPHHNVGAFATALRAVGEPIRGKRAKDVNITQLLDGLFAITRSFDMQVQPHLLLLQKTMVMVEGVALTLDPHVNMWEVAEPYVRDWVRDEMGPEAIIADSIVENVRALVQLPRLFRQYVAAHPVPGAAPEGPALPPLPTRRRGTGWSTPWLLLASGAGAAAVWLLG
ncbi:AarF/UbiB family protein [Polymorphobacter fuscus]|uniref:Ubiquinone biosynthesis protein UbiB n=1 Tax=Sandarakinorhabdus fusca TaxID=1439888 RepID=A0A7C9KJM9_9SPHN|nr:AarF/UbiB family protein [Polymorphobacter fuscus]KAB7644065.1 ubiquinone biosynthesis protein UbiB [Polymorphobacter fuscus]MQT18440.1 ubiquinone biosynthesis protein UbiB [Polymorphobacter fuscus]NJC08439.1 ubiquinone biosynthesis protein [Polymorphobacter fuscus]